MQKQTKLQKNIKANMRLCSCPHSVLDGLSALRLLHDGALVFTENEECIILAVLEAVICD
jgi:hypothetical protein